MTFSNIVAVLFILIRIFSTKKMLRLRKRTANEGKDKFLPKTGHEGPEGE
jgi:hypothetical protein